MEEQPSKEQAEIRSRVKSTVSKSMASVYQALRTEFGRIQVNAADLWYLEDIIQDIAECAAKDAFDVMSDARYQNSMQASTIMIKAALAVAETKSEKSATDALVNNRNKGQL